MIFVDVIILVEENLKEVDNSLDEWRIALEGRELRISRNKIKYIDYNFGGRYHEVEGMRPMMINGDVIDEIKNFKYLGSF
jgi:hypothetical protein